jgi:multicomponent K+:H+ antiporter subunit D
MPGFIGKLMMLEAAARHDWHVVVWAVILGVALLTLIGLARAGSILFWHVRDDLPARGASGASPRLVAATLSLLAATVAMSVWAAPIQRYTEAAARQLVDRQAYARAVIGDTRDTTWPYPAGSPAVVPTRPPGGMPARPADPGGAR